MRGSCDAVEKKEAEDMGYKFRRKKGEEVVSENGGQNRVDCSENGQLGMLEKGYEKVGLQLVWKT